MPIRARTTASDSVSGRLDAERRAVYERAVYRVDAEPEPYFLRVGASSGELDQCLADLGVARCAFVSAANPGSSPLTAAENDLRHRRLVARLRAAGHPFLTGESFEATTGGWREKSLLIAGIDVESAMALAREFGQAALLVAEVGGPVRLIPARNG